IDHVQVVVQVDGGVEGDPAVGAGEGSTGRRGVDHGQAPRGQRQDQQRPRRVHLATNPVRGGHHSTQSVCPAGRLPQCRSRPTMRQTHTALVRAPACRGAGSRGSNGRTASGREIPACGYLVGMSSARYRWAKVAASDLFLTCSLAKTFPTWVATVLVLMYRRAAISALVSP